MTTDEAREQATKLWETLEMIYPFDKIEAAARENADIDRIAAALVAARADGIREVQAICREAEAIERHVVWKINACAMAIYLAERCEALLPAPEPVEERK